MPLPRQQPDPRRSADKYRTLVSSYDRRTRRLDRDRRSAIERLVLWSGDTVLDVGCGTGMSFSLLERYVGPKGRIVGVDLSPEMLGEARDQSMQRSWSNITLIESTAEEAAFPQGADAALFSFTHDILRSAKAIENVVTHLRPGARVVAVGVKRVRRWRVAANLTVRRFARRYDTTSDDLDRPWSILESFVSPLQIESLRRGAGFIAWGERPHSQAL